MNWWQLETAEVLRKSVSSKAGLTTESAQARMAEVGPNELLEKKRKPALKIFLNQFKDFMIVVLLAAAIVGIAGDLTDTIIIVVIVILNAIVGFVQENKAEKAMEALKRISVLTGVEIEKLVKNQYPKKAR